MGAWRDKKTLEQEYQAQRTIGARANVKSVLKLHLSTRLAAYERMMSRGSINMCEALFQIAEIEKLAEFEGIDLTPSHSY